MRETILKLMLRAGIGSQAELVRICEKLAPGKVGKRRNSENVGRTMIQNLLQDKAKGMGFDQIRILCKALQCTPNELFGWETVNINLPNEDRVERLEKKIQPLLDILTKDVDIAETLRRIREEAR